MTANYHIALWVIVAATSLALGNWLTASIAGVAIIAHCAIEYDHRCKMRELRQQRDALTRWADRLERCRERLDR